MPATQDPLQPMEASPVASLPLAEAHSLIFFPTSAQEPGCTHHLLQAGGGEDREGLYLE